MNFGSATRSACRHMLMGAQSRYTVLRTSGASLPKMDWRLRGHYTVFKPGRSLAFTWKWDHDPADAPPKLVTVDFAPAVAPEDVLAGGARPGARLTLSHGPYLDTPEEQELRVEHHLAGWRHFLPILQRVAGARAD